MNDYRERIIKAVKDSKYSENEIIERTSLVFQTWKRFKDRIGGTDLKVKQLIDICNYIGIDIRSIFSEGNEYSMVNEPSEKYSGVILDIDYLTESLEVERRHNRRLQQKLKELEAKISGKE